jgi:membrane protease subunit HflK
MTDGQNGDKKKTPSKNVWSFDDLPENGLGAALKELQPFLALLRSKRGPILAVVAMVALMVGLSMVFFQLEPEEEAVVLRLGKPIPKTFGPGLHMKIPVVDQVFKVPVSRQQRLEFGFRSGKKAGKDYSLESLMLTGDLMLVQVRWSLVYKIEDIHAWLFKIKGREPTVRDISMAVMRQIVGDYSLEEVLTTKQLEIATLATESTQAALREKVPTGVVITEVAIKTADVPKAARKAFDDLTRTLAKVQGELAEAKADQDNAIGVARSKKNEAIGRAEKLREQVTENARGEAAAFLAKTAEYERAPEITRQWMYLSTMTKVLKGLDEKLIIEDSKGSAIAKHLPLKDFFTIKTGGSK